jgi:hypothetical protein
MVQQERDAYYDERSDTWRDSEKGDAFLERTEAFQEVVDALEALHADVHAQGEERAPLRSF